MNIWATWCPPCRAEMPAIQQAYAAYHDRGFTVLAVNQREDATDITPRGGRARNPGTPPASWLA